MSRILIIGGHGKVALLTAPLLVEAGHEVTSFVRDPAHVDEVSATGASAVVADVERLDSDELADFVRGHDAIIWSAGAGGGSPERTRAVDRDAATRSMDAAAAAGVSRYVMVSYFGAGPDHGISPDDGFYHYAEAKAAADAHLRATELDWTILGPGTLTLDEPTGQISVEDPGIGHVSRANVASVIVATLADDSTVHRTINFNDGDTLIAEALQG